MTSVLFIQYIVSIRTSRQLCQQNVEHQCIEKSLLNYSTVASWNQDGRTFPTKSNVNFVNCLVQITRTFMTVYSMLTWEKRGSVLDYNIRKTDVLQSSVPYALINTSWMARIKSRR